jgi:hypothetical protein
LEYQKDSYMCKTIIGAGKSMSIIIITRFWN